jgi:hypothetical protein
MKQKKYLPRTPLDSSQIWVSPIDKKWSHIHPYKSDQVPAEYLLSIPELSSVAVEQKRPGLRHAPLG